MVRRAVITGLSISDIRRFWSKVKICAKDDCWEWLAFKNRTGYGQIGIGGRRHGSTYLAHRISYLIANGSLPQDKLVLHSCDNRACVNPRHLRIGTAAENTNDMMSRGRARHGRNTEAARIASTKIPEETVRSILSANGTLRAIAKQHGVSLTRVYDIRSGKSRSHLGAP